MLVELGSECHGVDRHEVAVVIEDHDLQEPAGSVGSDVEITVALVEYADGVADRVLDVEIIDAVLAGVVSDLRESRLSCLRRIAQVTLRRGASFGGAILYRDAHLRGRTSVRPARRVSSPTRGSSNGRAPAQRSAGLEVLTDGATDRFGDTDVLFGGP